MKTVSGVLGEIAGKTAARVAELKAHRSEEMLRREIWRSPLDFRARLLEGAPAVIAEIKFASPSEGEISSHRDPVGVAREYLDNGAAALSILTEPEYFKGDLTFLDLVRRQYPKTPILMKDFVVDPYQLALARRHGADAALLIAALFELSELKNLLARARALGLSALVEIHNEDELALARSAGADLIGVNNRDLKTLHVDLAVSERLISRIDRGTVAVSESGISSREQMVRLHDLGYHAFLVGTSLMKTGSPGSALRALLETP